ncbi:MAG: tryptophan--tRNA ligase [Thermoplasmatales archaeon SG8-52-3]|jgi:tryptophanyl-tRNA synthetase|nr:MAG: tryptophan--tRNA ligase [Thermoplasmatales archaeon SG8-52-3]
MKIDPWSSTIYQDYSRLRDEFGIEEFSEDLWKNLPNPHMLLRRGVIFGHRGFNLIKDSVNKKKPWAILTGLMPSGRMHLGHKMVIDEVIYYQNIGADINIAVADIEAFATRGYTLQETKDFALNEYIPNYIALGLNPEKCRIYFQSKLTEVKDLGYILGKKINWSQMQATYGFNGQTNMAHIFSPLVQTGDILHVQLEKFGGNRPTLVPVGVDQDPHIRLSRDIAQAHRLYNVTVTKDNKIGVFVKVDKDVSKLLDSAEKILNDLNFKKLKRITDYKAIYIQDAVEENIHQIDENLVKLETKLGGYGFFQPSATFHRFMTGLTGEKMSSSKPESAIFLTDSSKDAIKKIMHSKTGGAVTLEEQKKHGGKPDECVVYELFLYHLIEDDKELQEIYTSCKGGKKTCGECKKYAAELIDKMLTDINNKREEAKNKIEKYLEK